MNDNNEKALKKIKGLEIMVDENNAADYNYVLSELTILLGFEADKKEYILNAHLEIKIINILLKLMNLGYSLAGLLIARIYLEIRNDINNAMKYFDELYNDGYDYYEYLFKYLLKNFIYFPQKAFFIVHSLYKKGVDGANECLSYFYEKGIGVKADKDMALNVLRRDNSLKEYKKKEELYYQRHEFINEFGDYTQFYIDESNRLISYVGNNPIVAIPDGVEIIMSSAFKNADLFSITLPKTLKEIEDNSFNSCKRLVEVINKSDIDFSKHFLHAIEIKNTEEPGAVHKANEFYFYTVQNCNEYLIAYDIKSKNLELPVLKYLNKYIVNSYAFEYISPSIVYIPGGVIEIKDYAFEAYTEIEKMYIEKGLSYVGKLGLFESIECVIYNANIDEYKKINGHLEKYANTIYVLNSNKLEKIK